MFRCKGIYESVSSQHNSNYVVIHSLEVVRMQAADHVVTRENIAQYILFEQEKGASENALRRCRRVTSFFFDWLPEDKTVSRETLLDWRQHMKDLGYSAQTEQNYVKGLNRYLDYIGCSDLRFNKGRAKEIAGKQFGYLTAIEPTGEKERKDYIWRCRCRCGKEVEYPATRLLTGNTVSCGCLRAEHFKKANKYIDGTSLRQSVEEQVESTRASSGFTGVTMKRGRWKAYIRYKGREISLGCYDKLEDAVKARARGKELVRMDALGLLNIYEELHRNDPALPDRSQVKQANQRKQESSEASETPALRSNNTSGYPGVYRKRDKWAARITYRKATYHLGVFEDREEALAVRLEAEAQLKKDPGQFLKWLQGRKEVTEE